MQGYLNLAPLKRFSSRLTNPFSNRGHKFMTQKTPTKNNRARIYVDSNPTSFLYSLN